jgi:hypothetical protein
MTGISPLIDLVNGLSEFQPDTACHLDAGANLVYWFATPTGTHALSRTTKARATP